MKLLIILDNSSYLDSYDKRGRECLEQESFSQQLVLDFLAGDCILFQLEKVM